MTSVAPGIFRSAQPKMPIDFVWLKLQGFKTVIDLENEPGEAAWEIAQCDGNGIRLITRPISAWRVPEGGRIQEIVEIMSNPRFQPVLVHCLRGEDRTGLVVGMYRRMIGGWSRRKAWREMLEHGFHPICLGLSWYFWSRQS